MTSTVHAAHPWSTNRRRAQQLRERYPCAVDVLALYDALLDVWAPAWSATRDAPPTPAGLADWALASTLPGVVKATESAGPAALATAVRQLADSEPREVLVAWLTGDDLGGASAEAYLARACLRPGLVALDDAAADACAADPAPRGDRHCPRCGGRPELSFRAAGGDRLVSGGRYLTCARCAHTWGYSASTCPFCGETSGSARTLYAEPRPGPVVANDEVPAAGDATYPHIRIEACASCSRYLLDIELNRDPSAVAEVDELAAIPLTLYAGEHGLTKITPNLMGL
jgi:formate dehydrogenase maturation protein FdhE